jgi:hypothetical protein
MTAGERIRVVLDWVQILDNLEPMGKEHGEFRFHTKVTPAGGSPQETRIPEDGHLDITDRPGWNRVPLGTVIYEGETGNGLVVEIGGEELDTFSANDPLDQYRREFTGPPSAWVGRYGPGSADDEGRPEDPENMKLWRVAYTIQKV